MKHKHRLRAVVVGFEYYGRFLSELIEEYSDDWSLRFYGSSRLQTLRAIGALRHADALICFGGPGPDLVLAEIARSRRVPVIVIWAGTDVIVARQNPGLLEIYKQYDFINVSDGPWLVDELRELGVEASYVPVTAVEPPDEPTAMPEQFSVISYLPEPRRTFYGEKAIYAVAREFPDVPFRIVGRGKRNPIAPPNVHFLGFVGAMPELLDRSSVLLRLPEHDGKSMLVLEALARARHVVWNYEFPGVHAATSVNSAIERVRELKARHERGELGVNREGFDFVSRTFRRPQLATQFTRVLDESQRRPRTGRERAHGRVAISGLPLFTAQIANLLRELPVGWEPQLLSVNGNLERLAAALQIMRVDVWYSIGSPLGDRWLHLFARMLRRPRVIHWVGSDLQLLRAQRGMLRACRSENVTHLAEVGWTHDELQRAGLEATIAPLPPRINVPAVTPALPERFTVLVYLPPTRGEFYGRREYERLFRTFASSAVRFLVVGGGEFYAPPGADVVALGWAPDMTAVYEQTTVLLRLTSHDGLALMALEALSCGRHVLWSQEFPYSTRVANYADCERAIRELLAAHEAGTLRVQSEIATEVKEVYSHAACISRLASIWDDCVQRERPAAATQAEALS